MTDPQKKIPVRERARARQVLEGERGGAARGARARETCASRALGSGSDYTPFLQHLGVASLNLGFGGEDGGGSYHSIYDSFDHYTRFGDPDFDYGVALAQVGGRVVLRLANADTLPFSFDAFADTVARYVREVAKLADDTREEMAESNRRIGRARLRGRLRPDGDLRRAEARRARAPPQLRPAPERARAPPGERAAYHGAALDDARGARAPRERATQDRLDRILCGFERAMTRAEGLPAPPLVQAPHLRARLLHRLRRQDAARRPRGHRAARLEGGRRPDRRRLRHAHAPRRPGRRRDFRVERREVRKAVNRQSR